MRAALSGLCPRCGGKTLFAGPAQFADECAQCGLDFLSLERGGRLVGVVTMALALGLILVALGVDAWLRPPLLPALVFWAVATVGVVIGGLRLYKTALLYAAYDRQNGPTE